MAHLWYYRTCYINKYCYMRKVQVSDELLTSVVEGDVDETKSLLTRGARVNERCIYFHNATLLHIAADCEHEQQATIVELLLKFGADINAVDKRGNSALNIALMRNTNASNRIACVLIDNGCDVNNCSYANHTPLHYACLLMDSTANIPIVRKLLHSGAKDDTVDKNGKTLLMRLLQKGYERVTKDSKCVEILIKHNFYTQTKKDHDNNTLLHLAAPSGYSDLINSILKLGIDIDAVNNKGEQALHIACLKCNIIVAYHLFNCYISFDGLLEFVTKHARDFAPEIVKVIWWNSAKLYALNKLSVHNKICTMFPILLHYLENAHFKFMKEIEKLKKTCIDETSVTLYDFLMMDSIEVVKLLENDCVVQYLSEYKLIGLLQPSAATFRVWLLRETYEMIPDKFFDVYNDNIYLRFQMGLVRKSIIDKCKRLAVHCSLSCLPLLCLELILFQLPNSDLNAFIDAFEQCAK